AAIRMGAARLARGLIGLDGLLGLDCLRLGHRRFSISNVWAGLSVMLRRLQPNNTQTPAPRSDPPNGGSAVPRVIAPRRSPRSTSETPRSSLACHREGRN